MMMWGPCLSCQMMRGSITVLPLTAPTWLHEKLPPLFVAKKLSPEKTLWLIYNRRFGGEKKLFLAHYSEGGGGYSTYY